MFIQKTDAYYFVTGRFTTYSTLDPIAAADVMAALLAIAIPTLYWIDAYDRILALLRKDAHMIGFHPHTGADPLDAIR